MNKRYYEHTLSTTREFIEYLRLNILLFTDIFEKIIIRCWVYLENIIRKRKMKHP